MSDISDRIHDEGFGGVRLDLDFSEGIDLSAMAFQFPYTNGIDEDADRLEERRLREETISSHIRMAEALVALLILARILVAIKEVRSGRSGNEPPQAAELLACLFTKKRYRESLLSDLDEMFRLDLSKGMTIRRARVRYWGRALNSIGPQLWAAVKRLGVIGFVADYSRRLMH